MKYITYVNSEGIDDIRLFSIMEQHNKVSQEMVLHGPVTFLGAGFVKFDIYGFSECHGHSDSMNLESRGEQDTKILNLNMKIMQLIVTRCFLARMELILSFGKWVSKR